MRSRRSVPQFAALGGVLLSIALAAQAREIAIATDPVLGTWQETVTIHVSGVSSTPCGAAVVTLSAPEVLTSPSRVSLQLREPCGATGEVLAQPFAFERTVVHLTPADYTVVVEDVDHTFRTAPFRVVDEGTQHLDVTSPVTDAAPVAVRIRGFGCPNLRPPQVAGTLVTLTIDSYCYSDFAGQSAQTYELEQQVGPLPAASYELRLVDTNPTNPSLARQSFIVTPEGSCIPSATALCLLGGRFEVTATWAAPGFHPPSGVAGATPIPGNDGSGLLWFFSADNAELTVKVLDGCPVNGHLWVFVASGSNVEYEVRVRDTRDGSSRSYAHAAGSLPPLVADVGAFAGCDP
jgi:hypothetical protein